ncbi:MAG: hypothetical protein PVJ57_16705 [Phycisphaerae bacterium]|jgi:hypothetical protein
MIPIERLPLLAATLNEQLWVAGGALLTIGLGVALLYWIDQEWAARDRRAAGHDVAPPADADDEPPLI